MNNFTALESDRDDTGRREFTALGTTAVVATTAPGKIHAAEAMLREELGALDRACSRFRADSEITLAHRRGGYAVPISQLLTDVIAAALTVANATDDAVDPTVGAAVNLLGYDRDFKDVHASDISTIGRPGPAPGWRCIELDRIDRTLRIPEGVVLDLGATAKAFAADRAAARIANATEAGVLVNLGGDISLSGPAPEKGWPIGLALNCATPPTDADVVIAIQAGGLASSGTTVRTWRNGGRQVHHIIDPKTGDSAHTCWQLVSVAAPSCVEANAASTAAVVWGADAIDRLLAMGLPSRLVRDDGSVVLLGGWPENPDESSGPHGEAA